MKKVIGSIVLLSTLLVGGLAFIPFSQAATATCSAPGGLLKGMTEPCYCAGMCTLCDVAQVFANVMVFLRNNIAFWLMIGMGVFGGFMMMFSGGSPKTYQSGLNTLLTAVKGFAAMVLITLILNTILVIILGTTGITWKSFVQGKLECPDAIETITEIETE